MPEETIFHKIIRKEIPAEILYEDEQAIAIRDINPVGKTHILVIPRKTLPSLREATDADSFLLGHLLVVASKLARAEGISEDGYRVVINSGRAAQQTVPQLHVHLIGGRDFSWPPG